MANDYVVSLYIKKLGEGYKAVLMQRVGKISPATSNFGKQESIEIKDTTNAIEILSNKITEYLSQAPESTSPKMKFFEGNDYSYRLFNIKLKDDNYELSVSVRAQDGRGFSRVFSDVFTSLPTLVDFALRNLNQSYNYFTTKFE